MIDDIRRIEQDLESTRARLDARIGELQDKLSPGQLLDQGLSYLKDNGGAEMSRNLKDSAVANPVPLALIGVGIAWMMMGGTRRPDEEDEHARPGSAWRGDDNPASRGYSHDGRSAIGEGRTAYTGESRTGYASGDLHARAEAAAAAIRRRQEETLEQYEDRVAEARAGVLGISRLADEARDAFTARVDRAMQGAREVLGGIREKAAGLGDRASEWLEEGRDRAGSIGDDALRSARHLGERVAHGVRDVADRGYEYGEHGVDGIRRGYGEASGSVRDVTRRSWAYVQEQPWVLAAVGLAVGALIGGMLPATRREREVLGPVGRDLRRRATGFVDQAVRSGTEIGSEVLGAASDAADREGLTLDAGKEAVAGLAEKVRNVVGDTVEAGKEALDRETGGAVTGKADHGDQRGDAERKGETRPAGDTGGRAANMRPVTAGVGSGATSSTKPVDIPNPRDIGLARGDAEGIATKTI